MKQRLEDAGARVALDVGDPARSEPTVVTLDHPAGSHRGDAGWAEEARLAEMISLVRFAYYPRPAVLEITAKLKALPCELPAMQRAQAEGFAEQARGLGWQAELRSADAAGP